MPGFPAHFTLTPPVSRALVPTNHNQPPAPHDPAKSQPPYAEVPPHPPPRTKPNSPLPIPPPRITGDNRIRTHTQKNLLMKHSISIYAYTYMLFLLFSTRQQHSCPELPYTDLVAQINTVRRFLASRDEAEFQHQARTRTLHKPASPF